MIVWRVLDLAARAHHVHMPTPIQREEKMVSNMKSTVVLGLFLALSQANAATAAEIKALAAIGIKGVFDELGPMFERSNGHKVTASYASLGGVVKQVQSGAVADIVIIPSAGIDILVKTARLCKVL